MTSPADTHISNEALSDEIEAVNSIYGDGTVAPRHSTSSETSAVLNVPETPFSFLVSFDHHYPDSPPCIRGTQSTGSSGRGEGGIAVSIVRDSLSKVWTVGQVCLFDLIEEARPLLKHGQASGYQQELEEKSNSWNSQHEDVDLTSEGLIQNGPIPAWTISDSATEKKSIFVARCAGVTTKDDVSSFIAHLLATNKRVSSATHNITAWRVRPEGSEITIQDCDDDGETAAGGRLLHLMQLMDAWNVMVVVTRWYGGTKLGPDRFRIINAVARDSLVKGGFVKAGEEKVSKKAKK